MTHDLQQTGNVDDATTADGDAMSVAAALGKAQDNAFIQWRMPEWIAFNGGVLTKENVMDYFSLSPFYDKTCNNQLLKMQSQFNRLGNLLPRLVQMTGVEFVVSPESIEQPLNPDGSAVSGSWTIFKQFRSGPDTVSLMKVYFVALENIYEAPNAFNLISSRLMNISTIATQTLEPAADASSFKPSIGFSYSYRQSAG